MERRAGAVPVLAISLMSFLLSMNDVQGSETRCRQTAFVKKFIAHHTARIGLSRQLVFATQKDPLSRSATVQAMEKKGKTWQCACAPWPATIGENGFAHVGQKREGDGRSPTGIFHLGTAFGYPPSVPTRMAYRQVTDDDYWMDDVRSEDYNRWVRGRPGAASGERLKRTDDTYKYGLVIEYNMNPVVKGRGSAIFIHVWRGENRPTLGCISMAEESVLSLLGWLDPRKKPLIIMGAEDELGRL